MFDSSAANAEERKICLAWVMDLPHPKGVFGFNDESVLVPSFSATPKGGTVGGSMEDFHVQQIYKAYPNIAPEWDIDYNVPPGCEPIVIKGPVFHQLDGGPDRLGHASLAFRIAAKAKGLILFPGLQNGTAANQVMDDLFGLFQVAMDEVMDDIVTERMLAAANAEDAEDAAASEPKQKRKSKAATATAAATAATVAAVATGSKGMTTALTRSRAAVEEDNEGEEGEDDELVFTDYVSGEMVTAATGSATTGKVVVTLNNNDLPRVVNGREDDPIHKRPFKRHFTKSKIVASVKKLGLYPISAEQACSHPKVRDDTKRAGQANVADELQAAMATNLAALAKHGVNTKALAVKMKKREAPIDEANIAGPQEYEKAYAKLVADGITSTNVWITLGAVAFNSAEVLAAELERVRILENGKKKIAYDNEQKFLTLQSDAKEAWARLPKPKKGILDFDVLKAGELSTLVRYVYKADSRENISKQALTKQACVDYLSALEKGELKKLLDAPLLLEGTDLLEAPTAEANADQQPFHIMFGAVNATDMKGLVPIADPDWLEESLATHGDKQLDGKSILVNWGNETEPEWLVGKLSTKGD